MTTQPSTQSPSSTLVRLFWLALSIFTSAPIAILYGLGTRILFGGIPGIKLPDAIAEPIGALSVAFLFLVPLAIGVLTVAFAPAEWRTSIWYAIAMPLLNCMLWSTVVAFLLWEAAVCVIMALPIVLPLAVVGGLIMWTVFKVMHNMRGQVSAVALIVILPYILGPIESRFPVENSIHSVESTVIIHASPDVVWRNIVRVPAIQPSERDFRIFHLVGVPWPVEATLTHDSASGLRAARYDNGLRWSGPVIDWQPNQTVAFEIHIQDSALLPGPYNGFGHAFDFQDARYTLEPLANGDIRLHLMSHNTLTTRFNAYGSFWTSFFVNDIQEHILHVIKLRAEAGQ
jgi:hypothetical protein